MMRSKPLKPGRGFSRSSAPRHDRDPDRVRSTPTPTEAFRMPAAIEHHAAPVEKEDALQHGVYMALVRMLPCARCGRHAPSQFCHRDMGKGLSMKTDCREGFPGCPTCHELLGSSGRIPRAERRELELTYGRETRAKITTMGLWPKKLPPWREK